MNRFRSLESKEIKDYLNNNFEIELLGTIPTTIIPDNEPTVTIDIAEALYKSNKQNLAKGEDLLLVMQSEDLLWDIYDIYWFQDHGTDSIDGVKAITYIRVKQLY